VKRHLVLITTLTAGLLFALGMLAPTSGAQTTPGTLNHCGANVVGKLANGEYVLGPQECFASQGEVNQYLASSAAGAPVGAAPLSPDTVLTTFYDPPSYNGTSFSVGYSCGSGYLNFTEFAYPGGGTWNDKVSAVVSSCSYVSLYYNVDLKGSVYYVYGEAILTGTGMDNEASSAGIAYG